MFERRVRNLLRRRARSRAHVFSTSQEPGAEYDIGLAVNYGPNELAIVVGVVLKVGILYKDDIPGGLSESRPEGCSLPRLRSWKRHTIPSPLRAWRKSAVPSVERRPRRQDPS